MPRHRVVTVLALLLSASLALAGSPTKGSKPAPPPPSAEGRPTTITCYDICTGEEHTFRIDHPNTPQWAMVAPDYCFSGVMAKTCHHGAGINGTPPTWKGGIWKVTSGWWNL